MSRTTFNQSLPKAPVGVITVNATTGNDANDGFVGPVASDTRAQEIIEMYDWKDGSCSVQFTSHPTNLELDFSLGLNLKSATITFTGTFENFIDLNGPKDGNLSLKSGNFAGDIELHNGGHMLITGFELVFFSSPVDIDSLIVTTEIIDIRNASSVQMSFGVKINGLTAVSKPVLKFKGDRSVFMVLQLDDMTSVDVTSHSLIETEYTSGTMLFSFGGSYAPITGKFLQVESIFGNPNIVNIGGFTIDNAGTLPSSYPAASPVNNSLSRGSYIDDAAAGAAGVLSGHFYENTTLGALAIKV